MSLDVSGRTIQMKSHRMFEIWKNLRFWQRVVVETSICLVVAILLQFLIRGSSAEFGEGIVGALLFGLFYSIIDHAFFAPNKKGRDAAK